MNFLIFIWLLLMFVFMLLMPDKEQKQQPFRTNKRSEIN